MGDGIKPTVYSHFTLGDMAAYYMLEKEDNQIELLLIPVQKEKKLTENFDALFDSKRLHGDSLIQVKLLDDIYPGAYGPGTSMRNSGTVDECRFEKQVHKTEGTKEIIETWLEDGRGHHFVHILTWTKGEYALGSTTTIINNDDAPTTLELLTSFSIGLISPFEEADASECLKLHRIRSKWSQEGRLVTESAEDLQLEPSWAYWQVNSTRYGQIGSMPVKGYFPFGAVEDTKEGVVWAAQLAIECSWQMEFYRRDDGMAFSGGLADREFGQWMKTIKPGESFTTPEAILTVCCSDERAGSTVDYACQRLTQYAQKYVNKAPESEQHLPILFNEYCTTWGLPSHENIKGILEAVKGKGLEYFVVDCGWFVEEGVHWSRSMGDYVPSDRLFPEGLGAVSDDIRKAGMKPGIWFEIDNVGRDSHVYSEREDLMLHRDGKVLTTKERRFFDMCNPDAIAYLTDKVIGQLKKYNFEYMKMDYNDTIGIGCDGAESLGEGLRRDREASVNFVRKVKEEIPGIILENCASGGHKLEPLMMSECSMASFSDAHECEEIPVIAASLHRSILPRQSQIWAVIRKTDSVKRIGYTVASTFLGRMCFSGDVTELSAKQWKAIEDGMAFYKKAAPAIRDGYSYIYSHKGSSDRHLTGWQAVIRVQSEEGKLYEGKHESAFVTAHIFHGEVPEKLVIDLPEGCPNTIAEVYAPTAITAKVEGRQLIITPSEEMEAISVLLK